MNRIKANLALTIGFQFMDVEQALNELKTLYSKK